MLGLHHETFRQTGNAVATNGADMGIRNTETADNTAICHDLRITLKISKVVSNLGTLSIGGTWTAWNSKSKNEFQNTANGGFTISDLPHPIH